MKDLKYIKIAGQAVSHILKSLREVSRPGISGKDLESLARELMEKKKVKSSSLGYRGFPAAICVSLNEELTHGVPDERKFKSGDLVSVDVACSYKGYHADAALTMIIGEENDEEKKKLLAVTKEALWEVIKIIKPGVTTTQNIGEIIENYVSSRGYHAIKEYGGHGIGKFLHTRPFIPNYKTEWAEIIQPNTAICIEPLVQFNDAEIKISNNNWTVISANGHLNAHFEHTVWIGKEKIEVITNFDE